MPDSRWWVPEHCFIRTTHHESAADHPINIVMYGPPRVCKRKLQMAVWSAQMYSAFSGNCVPWPRWIPPALFLISEMALVGR